MRFLFRCLLFGFAILFLLSLMACNKCHERTIVTDPECWKECVKAATSSRTEYYALNFCIEQLNCARYTEKVCE